MAMTSAEVFNQMDPEASKQQQGMSSQDVFNMMDSSQKSKPDDSSNGLLQKAGESILAGAGYVGKQIDKYGGAPVRSALGGLIAGEGPSEVVNDYKNQFGADPTLAPTGQQLAGKLGVPNTSLSSVLPSIYKNQGESGFKPTKGGFLDPTASGAAGFGIDLATDPTNLIPGETLAKGLTKGIEGTKSLLQAPFIKAAEMGEKIAPIAEKAANLANKGTMPALILGQPHIAGLLGAAPEAVEAAIKAGEITKNTIEKVMGPVNKLDDLTIKKFIKIINTSAGAMAFKTGIAGGKAVNIENQKNGQ